MMSTPSTATATHPTSHHPQHYGYSHHPSYHSTPSYPSSSSATSAAAAAAAAASRLSTNTSTYPYAINPSAPAPTSTTGPGPATTTATAPSSSSATVPSATTSTLPYAQSPKILPPLPPPHQNPPSSSTPATMTSSQTALSAGVTPTQNGRNKKPDWGEFYKNGLPKEVIVIDDSPPPDPLLHNHTASAAHGGTANPLATSTTTGSTAVATPNGTSASASSLLQHPAGKKRRTGVDSAYDVGYYDRPSYSINPQHYGEDSSAASRSTDRTTSMHTTAPTSLGSHGSSGGSNTVFFEDANIGQKRKRVTTRKSTRDEQKRRELEAVGDAFLSYVPPPNPPIKAKDVAVPVVRDVCFFFSLFPFFLKKNFFDRS